MMVIGFDGKTVPPNVIELIHKYNVGGIILFGRNIGTPEEILSLTTELQKEAKAAGQTHPLLICVDQENGAVRRLGEGTTVFPGAMTIGATDSPENGYKIGLATGRELKSLGINWNLAPVLDVNNNPDNPVIGIRSFGESPQKVAEFGKEVMKGMQEAGVMTTLKHFPGHGDTSVDSHLDLPIIAHDRKRLDEVELKPFRACIEEGADTVMTAHVYFPAIEDQPGVPATLSKKVITGLLREELGFDGVVTTDCMEMNAISKTIGTQRGGVEAVKAGVDLIMVSHSIEWQIGTIEEIFHSVESGEIKEDTINKALNRIYKLKEKYLDWNEIPLEGEVLVPDIVGCKQHENEAYEVYRQGVTIVKNNGLIPLSTSNENRVLVLSPENNSTMQVEDKRYSTLALGEAIQEFHPSADIIKINNQVTEQEMEEIINKASSYDTIIIGTLSLPAYQKKLIEKLYEKGLSLIVIAMRSPYDLAYLPDVSVYINTYEFTYPALKVAAGAIYGKETVSGKLPVTISK